MFAQGPLSAVRERLGRGGGYGRPSVKYIAFAAFTLAVVALAVYALWPRGHGPIAPPPAVERTSQAEAPAELAEPTLGPLAEALQSEIAAALQVRQWPLLNPTMDDAINGPAVVPEVEPCGVPTPPEDAECTWGSETAPVRAVLVGDELALNYAGPLRELALNSNGRFQLHVEAMPGCPFADDLIFNDDQAIMDACAGRRQRTVDYIAAKQPTVVFVAHSYGRKFRPALPEMTPADWTAALRRMVDKTGPHKVVLLAPPPIGYDLRECYGKPSSVPSDCTNGVSARWNRLAYAEQKLAADAKWAWIDSRPWFCSGRYCPAFVGTTPTRHDEEQMTPAYGSKISPVIAEALHEAGIL